MKKIKSLLRNDQGATLIEYGLIVAVVGLPLRPCFFHLAKQSPALLLQLVPQSKTPNRKPKLPRHASKKYAPEPFQIYHILTPSSVSSFQN